MFSDSRLYKEDLEYITKFDVGWDELSEKNILVTGATGLIGTVLVDALMYKNKSEALGTRVFALTRSKENIRSHFRDYVDNKLFVPVEGDISQSITLDEQVDYIVNLAGNTHPGLYANEPIMTIDSIVLGMKNILEFATRSNVKRVINTTTVEVYGENRGDTERFTEDYCGYINSNTLRAGYPESKRLTEALCQAYISEKNIDAISARLGRVYGAPILQSDTKATSQFIRSAVAGENIVLKSEGKQEYSYVYVADAVVALLLLLVRGVKGEAYNIADDEVKTFSETASILAGINNKEVIFNIPSMIERKGYSVVQKALMDSSKIQSIGWRSKYNLHDGLERTVSILRVKNET